MMLASNVRAGESTGLKKNTKGMQAKDTVRVSWTDNTEVGYKKGLFIKTKDEKYSLRLQFLLQPQYQYLISDSASNVNTFTMRHGQMRFSGNFFDPRLKYKVMFELPGTQGGATANLRDLWIDWQWKKYFQIKIGQFFVFFDHENLEPTWSLQFGGRSIINAVLGFERDIGVDIHGSLFSEHLNYDLFLMNGDGRNQTNLNNKLMAGGRIMADILGKHNYLISDLEKSHNPVLGIGAAALYYDMGNTSIDSNRLIRATGDMVFRYMGLSVLGIANMAYNIMKEETDYGFLGQVGFFFFPNRFEIAGRWAQIFENGVLEANTITLQEAGTSLNYYFNGHNVKLRADYSHLWNNKSIEGRNDDRIRLQLQLFF